MKSIIETYKEEIKKLFKDKCYIIFVVLTAILGFGYLITHTTVGMDDTSLDRYYSGFFDVNIIIPQTGRKMKMQKILYAA